MLRDELFMLIRLFKKLDINSAIVYALSTRGWQLLAGPVTLFFIAHFFMANQQGFFYTFNSILLLQIFFEMGFSYVLIQFASHEFAHLRWTKWGGIKGGLRIKRFKQLLRTAFRWYWVVALVFFVIVLPVGWIFLGLKDTGHLDFQWRLPWALLVSATALNLVLSPLLAVIEGSGRVKEINRLRFAQTLVATLVTWIVIVSGGGLFCASSLAISTAVISMTWLMLKNPLLIRLATAKKTLSQIKARHFSWREEVWPMQWRIAVSWISGYFINQIFVPILFLYQSPAVAGQMGMSLAVSTMIAFVGQAWLVAKAPFLGRLVAEKRWQTLDQMFYRLVWQSVLMVVMAGLALLIVVIIGQRYVIFQRLLPPGQLAFLICSAVLTHGINCIAQYLRSHKREPFMLLSVIGALFITVAAWYGGRTYSSYGIVIAVFLINALYGLPTALWFWCKYRREWHRCV